MTITTTLKHIVNAQGALTELASYKTTGRAAYDAGKLIRKCTDEIEAFHKARQTSFEAYGVLDPAAATYSFPTRESRAAVERDTLELFARDVVLEVAMLAFADLEKINPTIGLWTALDWAIAPPTE